MALDVPYAVADRSARLAEPVGSGLRVVRSPAPPRSLSGLSAAPATGADWEAELLRRLTDRDHTALAELHDRLGPIMLERVERITGERLSAGLLTLGVFARVWRSPQDFAAGGLRCSLLLLADCRARQWTASAAYADAGQPVGLGGRYFPE